MVAPSKDMTGICPACNGTTRKPVSPDNERYKTMFRGYDAATDTLPCTNCGGQMMFTKPSGRVRLRPDGTPCLHEYTSASRGRCLARYTCEHCGHQYDIDSGD